MDHKVEAEEKIASERLNEEVEEQIASERLNAEAEEKIAQERLQEKLNEIDEIHIAPLENHFIATLGNAFFKCTSECFDEGEEDIINCFGYCFIPLSYALEKANNEMTKFEEKLDRSLKMCQDKYEAAKLEKNKEALTDHSVHESIQMLPLLFEKIKASISINEDSDS